MTVLPKPARVEKWQRWRDQGAEYVVSEIREGAFDRAYFADGQCCSMYDMRASSYWTFVGYAKPVWCKLAAPSRDINDHY
jgi:hypothetical protein